MPAPVFRWTIYRSDLSPGLPRLLAGASVRDRLVVLDEGLAALADRRPYTVNLHQTTITLDVGQVRALSRSFLTDPSLQVRRRLARGLVSLDWPDRFPLVARLLWDPDDRVRQLAEKLFDVLEPLLNHLDQGLRPLSEPAGFAVPVVANFGIGAGSAVSRRKSSDSYVVGQAGAAGPGGGGNVPPPPPGGPDKSLPLDDEIVRRYTACDFKLNRQVPASGHVSFALRTLPSGPESRPVDLRVPEGKEFATVLVHAFSRQFAVSPEIWIIKIPRAEDSDVADFRVLAEKPDEGEVGLLVYDEHRLIGSITLRLRAVETPEGLTLEKVGAVIFRDPAPTVPSQSNGITVQASLNRGDSRVAFHLLLPLADGSDWHAHLFPLGRSAALLEAASVQTALTNLRDAVDVIEKGLDEPATLGATNGDQALESLRMSLEGAGHQIGEDLLSPVARAVLASLDLRSVVHWVIRDPQLDAVPWELAWNAATGHHLNQDIVLVRVPVRDNSADVAAAAGLPSAPALPPAPNRFRYVLGQGVVTAADKYPAIREVVKAVGGYKVVTNFENDEREAVNVVQLRDQMKESQVIHLLCHGVVEEKKGLYLEIEENALGRLNPSQVRAFHLAPNAVVFINACSSAAATMSLAGFTSFGWSFLCAGAGSYVGSLAPVTTRLALLFAQSFFEAYLDRKLPLPQAMYEARQRCAGDPDPTWLLYTLYGDLSYAQQIKE